jgi:hypothetical protein
LVSPDQRENAPENRGVFVRIIILADISHRAVTPVTLRYRQPKTLMERDAFAQKMISQELAG